MRVLVRRWSRYGEAGRESSELVAEKLGNEIANSIPESTKDLAKKVVARSRCNLCVHLVVP
eukprot:6739194-Lingulodinium_polyedra.AAC.1